MHRWSLFVACTALLLLFCDSRCVAQQASVARTPKSKLPAVRPQGTLVRPEGGVQHPDLDKAWVEYDEAVAEACAQVRAAIAKKFDSAAADGDLDAAERWEAALKKFDDNGQLPSESGTKNAVSEAVNGLKKAKESLAEAYIAAVKSLTREKKMTEAKAIREEAKAFSTSTPVGVPESSSSAGQSDSTPRPPSHSSPVAKRVDEKPKAYDQTAKECQQFIERRRAECAGQYSSAVWNLKGQFQQEGELQKALAAEKEWTRALDRKPLTPANVVEAPEELRKLQKEYLTQWETFDEKVATEFLARIDDEAAELAKKGRLTEGRILQQEIDKIKRLYLRGGKAGLAAGAKSYEDPVAACEEAIQQKRVAIQAQYVGELEALEKAFQAQGALESVFASKAERKRFAEAPLLAEENLVESPDALQELQQKYLELQQNVTTSVAEEFVARLEQQKQALTIEGKLEEAVKAKNDAEEIRARYLSVEPSGLVWRDITASLKGGAKDGGLIVLRRTDAAGESRERVISSMRYSPPIEIEYVCETTRDNIRLGYACKKPVPPGASEGEMILGWEVNPQELRVDGGPAFGRHVANAGSIPVGRMVTIRQLVLPNEMRIDVDNQHRAAWNADFSEVNDFIEILPTRFSDVHVKSIRIRKPD